ncbi:MAG TPA: hypothetical protein PLY34_13210 [Ferruginibacter sp.]|nr:hypothetical protein [Ferruginibacter sp.]HPH92577.1 hypothetical protein [Ferruginibacter sp.]
MSTKRIKRIDPMQSGKVTAIVSVALILIIFVPFMLLFSLIGMGTSFGGAMLGGSLFMIILLPIIYGIVGFIIGILYAVVYNFTYKYHGGLQLEYDDMDDEISRIGN